MSAHGRYLEKPVVTFVERARGLLGAAEFVIGELPHSMTDRRPLESSFGKASRAGEDPLAYGSKALGVWRRSSSKGAIRPNASVMVKLAASTRARVPCDLVESGSALITAFLIGLEYLWGIRGDGDLRRQEMKASDSRVKLEIDWPFY
jgi:hypothetical protein